MAEKLNPPYIEGSIPARYGDTLIIPYMMNSTVNEDLIIGFRAKVKTLVSKNNNDLLFSTSTIFIRGKNDKDRGKEYFGNFEEYKSKPENKDYLIELSEMKKEKEARFNLTIPQKIENLKVGQYYKVQLAFQYVDNNGNVQDGNFSTVGIFKWTTKPLVEIKGFTKAGVNPSSYQYIGTYKQIKRSYDNIEKPFPKDPTEKVEKYRFRLFNSKGAIIEDTGWQIHDSSTDSSTDSSYDIFEYNKDIPQNEIYQIQYRIVTNNGLDIPMRYNIKAGPELKPEEIMVLHAENNEENGYVKLYLTGGNASVWGTFKLLRRDIADKYGWEEISKFVLDGKKPSTWTWKDFTVEHNKTYVYAYQQYMNNYEGERLFSYKIESNPVTANFEHLFLWDGEKQLKVCFDPKVSSFKTVKMESKTETIGNKYPFFFRNGKISYKDFPISGLISYWSDDENLFASNDLLVFDDFGKNLDKVRTTNLTDLNYHRERNFKIKVLNWLNDGQVKLFRSPSEGNFLVRLMNVSLSPNEILGRMLHSFSCNAYEVDSCSYSNLLKYGFLDINEEKFNENRKIQMWASVTSNDIKEKNESEINGVMFIPINIKGNFTSLKIEGFKPGTTFAFRQEGKKERAIIVIGATGSYSIDNMIPCTNFYIRKSDCPITGTITYGYEKEFKNSFGAYNKIEETIDVPARIITLSDLINSTDIIDFISDVKTQVSKVSYIKFTKDIHTSVGSIMEELKLYDANALFPNTPEQYYCWMEDGEEKIASKEDFSFKFTVDGNEIDITDTEIYILNSLDNIKDMKINLGLGVKAQIGYTANIIEYIFELEYNSDTNIHEPVEEKNNMLNAKSTYLETLTQEDLEAYNNSYSKLIDMLEIEIANYKEQGGIV